MAGIKVEPCYGGKWRARIANTSLYTTGRNEVEAVGSLVLAFPASLGISIEDRVSARGEDPETALAAAANGWVVP